MPLQGLQQPGCPALDKALWFLQPSFPQQQFPLGCMHEFLAAGPEEMAATRGFIHTLLSHLLSQNDTAAWVGSTRNHFPVALSRFHTSPNQLLFIQQQREKELYWVVEEFLKYKPLKALVAELETLDFTASRRFQLAIERSGITSFIIRRPADKNNNNIAAVRWRIQSLPSVSDEILPGIGYPSWKIDLLKVKHGKPASVELVWRYGSLMLRSQMQATSIQPQKLAV